MALDTNEDPPPGGSPGRLPLVPQATRSTASGAPAIPLHLIDAPTQRFYAVAVYFALVAWKLYNWGQLVEDNAESFWLFLKWVAIDFVFLFGLPELRIPWLELSQPFVLVAFFCHVVFNWMLMFNVGLPWQTWLFGFVKVVYDQELAISEHNVKLSNILHNSSLIMGRQVINILPEGTAVLNPERLGFCVGSDQKAVTIPIYFNATVPVQVELIRMDLETNKEEVLKLSKPQLLEIKRQAQRQEKAGDHSVVQFDYSTKKPGAYRLGQVLDEYKLEVQRRTPYTFIVPCPRAEIMHPSTSRCHGDLSDLSLQVEGTPPLKVHYSRTINGKDHSFHFQSLQPDGFVSPLVSSHSLSFVGTDETDVTWARPQQVTVSLNESMNVGGSWQYSVDEINDAFGNVVKYTSSEEDQEPRPKPKHLVHNFIVKERPRMRLEGCDLRNPLKVEQGKAKRLPTVFNIPGHMPDDTSHSLTWQFSPIDTLTKNGDHGDVVMAGSYHAKNARDRPAISAPGLYTLKSVSSGSCEGEIEEPSSCLLLNPLEPRLMLQAENIPDKCAGAGASGNSIGLRVDMDLIGTPPFIVQYEVISNGVRREKRMQIPGVRHQMELVPKIAGHHKYTFTYIGDDVYADQPLHGPEYILEQDVKPAPSAIIQHSLMKSSACLEEEIEVPILLHGEAPFTLEWELVHEGKRKHQSASGITDGYFRIKTAPLSQGGEYTLVLTRVQDKRGCPQSLKEETKISVRRQRPRAAFGLVDGRRRTTVIESAKASLPVRLTGEAPWTISYRNLNDSGKIMEKILRNDNDNLDVAARGIYEITDIRDKQCHGSVDPKLSTFEVDWLPRPELSLVPVDSISEQRGRYVKQEVCEGDIDGFDIGLKGSPPYLIEYRVQHKPTQGSSSSGQKMLETMNSKATIQMDTSKAGLYTYTFSSLADSLYNNDRKFKPLSLEQRVNAKPSASFVKPGQTFKYCMSEQDAGDKIPISLVGVPPFSLEVEIRHQSGVMPETFRIPSIESNSYGIHVPRQHLKLGTQQVRIREVKDARGCQSKADMGGPSVQVQLYDAPAIYPLETRNDYCVGERLSYTLSGTPPFEVWYTFGGTQRKAKSSTTSFRRIAESPGEFRITSVSDKASECRASVDLAKTIHPLPSVKISRGMNVEVDIHEGGEVDILFEFWGTPPFEFTYTRSANARKGQKGQLLETRHDISYEHSKTIRASQEGTYEVVAIKDKFCSFSTQPAVADRKGGSGQKLLM